MLILEHAQTETGSKTSTSAKQAGISVNSELAGHASLRKLGLRERNKLEKRQRIRAAARALFSKRGYESATLRQIATRARVGLGTLFQYAGDKRDLVFLIFNEELGPMTDEALKAALPGQSLLDQLLAISRTHYEYFAKTPALSRILLREMAFYSEGRGAAEFQQIRARLILGMERLVREAQQEGRIGSKEDPGTIALAAFWVYVGALRQWIRDPDPDPEVGIRRLRRFFAVLFRGLEPQFELAQAD